MIRPVGNHKVPSANKKKGKEASFPPPIYFEVPPVRAAPNLRPYQLQVAKSKQVNELSPDITEPWASQPPVA